MEFGKVPEARLAAIDFSLPAEPRLSRAVLTGVRATHPQVFAGGTQWGVKEWIGKVYPRGTRADQLLPEYTRQYNCVELNATHYKIYPPATIRKWAAATKDPSFRFCPKVFQEISHKGSLLHSGGLLSAFYESVAAFEDHLGPVFMQLSEAFGPARAEELFAFLENLPPFPSFFVELRHPDWFTERHRTQTFRTLHHLGVGAVITDTAGRRDCCHMHLTLPKAFIRFVGNNLHPTDFSRVEEWAERIRYWVDHGLQELYFIVHMRDEALVPDLSRYVVEQLNKIDGLHLKKPGWNGPPELF